MDGYLWASVLAIHHSHFYSLSVLLPVSVTGQRKHLNNNLSFPASPEVTLLRRRAAARRHTKRPVCFEGERNRWTVTVALRRFKGSKRVKGRRGREGWGDGGGRENSHHGDGDITKRLVRLPWMGVLFVRRLRQTTGPTEGGTLWQNRGFFFIIYLIFLCVNSAVISTVAVRLSLRGRPVQQQTVSGVTSTRW